MNPWHHIPNEEIHKDGFTRLTLPPEKIKSQIEALPIPPSPPAVSQDVLEMRQELSRLATPVDVIERA